MVGKGLSIIVVGKRGAGKSNFLKGKISKAHKNSLCIFDKQGEYKDYYQKHTPSFRDFISIAKKLSDSVQVWEEMTVFLSIRSSYEEIKEICVDARHKNNMIFWVFHSLRTIPRDIFDLSDIIVLFKTNDSPSLIKNKFESEPLNNAFERVNQNKDPHYFEVVKIE